MAKVQQILRNGFSIATGNESRRETAFVELNRDFSFLALRSQVGQKFLENVDAALSADLNYKQVPVLFRVSEMTGSIHVEGQTEELAHRFDGAGVGHFNGERENIGRTLPSVLIVRTEGASLNRDAAFTVNQSCKVSKFVFHATHGITNQYQRPVPHQQNPANSVDTRPLMTRATPSQAFKSKEVCREHIRDPKGMTCSGLRSNAKRVAEMTTPAARRVTTAQDAKTAQIQWYGSLGVNNRRKHGVDSDIDTTITS